MGTLEGRTAIVTGAARGIGRAIAEKLASEGADLALCDMREEWLADTADAVRAHGRSALCLGVDVSKAEEVDRAVQKVLEAAGRIDALVNNAGIAKDALTVRMTESEWDNVLSVNLKGAFLFCKGVARPMMKQRCGAIVNIASIIGLIGNVGQSNYAASKAGVIALTKSVAKELASRNVRVNAIAPGFIESQMTDALPEDVRKKMLDSIPLKRFGTPEDVAKATLFLTDDSSSYVTGQVLTVSGGMVM